MSALFLILILGCIAAALFVFLFVVTIKVRKKAYHDFNFSSYDVVCAGSYDHGYPPEKEESVSEVNNDFTNSSDRILKVEQFHRLIVKGNSMRLCKINDGDLVFVKKGFVSDDLDDSPMPKILVVKRRNPLPGEAKYKLRRTWLQANATDSFDDKFATLASLRGFSDLVNGNCSPGLQSLIDNFIDNRVPKYFQDYPDARDPKSPFHKVIVSSTLDTESGMIHFSIHPVQNILGEVAHVFSPASDENANPNPKPALADFEDLATASKANSGRDDFGYKY